MPDASDKGAGGDAIFTRDFSAPTGEDKMDNSVLPKARARCVVSGLGFALCILMLGGAWSTGISMLSLLPDRGQASAV